MSKVVTILKDRNPFVVIVNGVKYSYPAGVTTEVPDEVADVIEKYVGAKPKPDPNAGINFGGTQSDWNQTDSSAADFIKNKPFGDSPTGGDTLTWDGNTEGLVQVGGFFCKVSDAIPTMEDIANGCTVALSTGNIFEATEDNIADEVFDFTVAGIPAIAIAEFVIITLEDNADLSEVYGFEFFAPKKGVYFLSSDRIFTSSLTIPGYTGFPVTKKMEAKYLPGAVILYTDAENYLYATSDTSDISKRMTKAELAEAVMSCKQIYVCLMMDEGALAYWTATLIGVTADLGMVELPDGAYFTAEYTG